VIRNPVSNTTASLLSTSNGSPTMPNGYTFKGLVGAIRNDSGSNLEDIRQEGQRVVSIKSTPLNQASATTATAVDLTNFIPTIATVVIGDIEVDDSSANATSIITLYTDNDETFEIGRISNVGQAANDILAVPFESIIVTDQTIYYKVDASTADGTIRVHGWEYK